MITFPCCKINLGLNVIAKRSDGYHDIQTVMYPIALTDALEIKRMNDNFPSPTPCDLLVTGLATTCEPQDNLVVKAYNLLNAHYKLPRIHIHLCKRIPSQAGLGGGSADGAYMIRLLDERFRLNMGNAEMEHYAALLGSDCPFFITAETAYATGRGEILEPADQEAGNLNGYWIALVKPDVAVSTAQAYAAITPKEPLKNCRMVVRQPIETWKDDLSNDFEEPVFNLLPQLANIKEKLYAMGACYAQMSGSGSTIFGIFREKPADVETTFNDCFTAVLPL